MKRYPALRWVAERTSAWLSKCWAILVRYEKKATNYIRLAQLACALLWYRRQWQLRFWDSSLVIPSRAAMARRKPRNHWARTH